MLDVSDGLVRDAGRIARASGVGLDLDPALLAGDVAALAPAVGEQEALRLRARRRRGALAAGAASPPAPRCRRGGARWAEVVTGAGVTVGGVLQGPGGGWDHFGG